METHRLFDKIPQKGITFREFDKEKIVPIHNMGILLDDEDIEKDAEECEPYNKIYFIGQNNVNILVKCSIN